MSGFELEIKKYIDQASLAILLSDDVSSFDLEAFLNGIGCTARLSNMLSDYIPAACGRIFMRELGVETSIFSQRFDENGVLGPEIRLDEDPIWCAVEEYCYEFSRSESDRNKFSAFARLSAEYDAINVALSNGETLEGLRGGEMGNLIFNAPLPNLPSS